jgi:hypothetical protein
MFNAIPERYTNNGLSQLDVAFGKSLASHRQAIPISHFSFLATTAVESSVTKVSISKLVQ